jgi:hypothetical protein
MHSCLDRYYFYENSYKLSSFRLYSYLVDEYSFIVLNQYFTSSNSSCFDFLLYYLHKLIKLITVQKRKFFFMPRR